MWALAASCIVYIAFKLTVAMFAYDLGALHERRGLFCSRTWHTQPKPHILPTTQQHGAETQVSMIAVLQDLLLLIVSH